MKKYVLISLITLMVSACGDNADMDGIQLSKDYIDAVSTLSISNEGGVYDLEITANCSWSVTNDATWLTLSSTSGSNTQRITVSATKNRNTTERTATIIISGGEVAQKRIVVSQSRSDAGSLIPDPDDNIPPK